MKFLIFNHKGTLAVRLEHESNALKQAHANAVEQVTTYETQLATLRHSVDEERKHTNEVRLDLRSKEMELKSLDNAKNELAARFQSLQTEIQSKQQELTEAQKEITKAQAEVSQAKFELKQAEREIHTVGLLNETSKTSVTRLEAKVSLHHNISLSLFYFFYHN